MVAGHISQSNTSIPSKNASNQISIPKPTKESMSKEAPEKKYALQARKPNSKRWCERSSFESRARLDKAAPANTVTYTVYVGKSSPSMSKEYTIIKNYLLPPIIPDPATTYYWKVEANSGQNIGTSDIWSFTQSKSLVLQIPLRILRNFLVKWDKAIQISHWP